MTEVAGCPKEDISNGTTHSHDNISNRVTENHHTDNSATGGFFSSMPPTKLQDQVPILFREPFIHSGFRPLYQHWSYYVKSLFQVHNECLNIWTHLIAFFVTCVKLVTYVEHFDLLSDPYMWPLASGFFVSFVLFLSSTGAHCFQSHSPHTHYCCFLLDYAGIGLYGFGCAQLHYYYCAEPRFYEATKSFFIPLSTCLGFFAFFANMYGKMKYRRPYPKIRKVWQIGPVGILYVTLISPVLHRLWSCYYHSDLAHCSHSLPVHIQQIICFTTSGFFYASSIPQKFFPGKFDFLAHSHQIFHVFIAFTTFYKFDAVLMDMQMRKKIITARPAPSFLEAFGPTLLIMCLEIIFIVGVQDMIREKNRKGH